jgi:hypothetical protein
MPFLGFDKVLQLLERLPNGGFKVVSTLVTRKPTGD